MKYLTPKQVISLLDAPEDPEVRLLFRVLYYIGGRVSEALALRPKDIVKDERVLLLPALKDVARARKGEPKRVVVDQVTLDMLVAWIKARNITQAQLIFYPDVANPSTRRWRAWVEVKKAGAKIGCPWIHPHTLRHSFAIHWASGGGDLVKLQRQLGHKKQSTTTDMYLQYATQDIAQDYDKIFPEGGKR